MTCICKIKEGVAYSFVSASLGGQTFIICLRLFDGRYMLFERMESGYEIQILNDAGLSFRWQHLRFYATLRVSCDMCSIVQVAL